ncbi:MAG: hypothetical protein P1S60_03895 [Anaerolineae bacterium]|nr:hypothetical protein [Anaerolineae bacterium]
MSSCTSDHDIQEEGPWLETFEGDQNWQLSTDASATVDILDGRLLIEVHIPGQVAWASHSQVWNNFQLTVEAEQLSGPLDNEFGILVRMNNDTEFYVLSISGDGFVRAALFQNDVWTVLGSDWAPSPHIHQGLSFNKLAVKVLDATISLDVNGQQVLEINDTTLEKGQVGLYAGAFGEGGVVVAFDNLEIKPLP